jgi:tetratricopeptide (TPR) repeat protein
VGLFVQQTQKFPPALLDALNNEVQQDMAGVVTLASAVREFDAVRLQEAVDWLNKREFGKAREILAPALVLQPDNTDVAFYLATAQYNLGEIIPARDTLIALLKKRPDHIDAAILVGQIFFRRKEWDALADCYEKIRRHLAADDKKNVIRVYGALGLAYYHLKKYNQAIETLSIGLQANPRDLSSSYHLALCYYAVGETEKAKKILESLRKTLPPDSQVLKNVIELLQRI